MPRNHLDQPIGDAVPGWTARARPPRTPMTGRFCAVVPLEPERHAAELHEANRLDASGANFTYLFTEPFATLDDYRRWLDGVARSDDPLFHAVIDRATGCAVGLASFMRVDPTMGVIEVGNINYSPRLQRRAASTEAMYLMMRRVFDELGYRRYEWKCDRLNAPSRATAERLGFTFEGIFRQAIVYKGRNRDTAWYSITDAETFRDLDSWVEEIKHHGAYSDGAPVILVGNKSDRAHLRAVTTEQGVEYARAHEFSFLETSALDNTNVDEAFVLVLQSALTEQLLTQPFDDDDLDNEDTPNAAKALGCGASIPLHTGKPGEADAVRRIAARALAGTPAAGKSASPSKGQRRAGGAAASAGENIVKVSSATRGTPLYPPPKKAGCCT